MAAKKMRVLVASIIAAILIALWNFPLFWIFLSSFKPMDVFGRKEIVWLFKPRH